MPITYDNKNDQDQESGWKPDGSHDDLGGLPADEQAKLDQMEAGLRDGDLADKESASSEDGEGGGFYKPDSDKEERGALDKTGAKDESTGGGATAGPSWVKGDSTSKNIRRFVGNSFMRKKTLALGGGAVGGIMILAFIFFSFFSAYKVTHIIESIEQRVGAVPEYAVERRLEYYMNKYLIMKTAAKYGASDAVIKKEYTYLGKGVFGTLVTNWQGAKLDTVLEQKYGARLVPKVEGEVFGRQWSRPSNWNLVLADGTVTPLNSREAREFTKILARQETKSHQVLKRYAIRKIFKNYQGIPNWKPFERQRESARQSYFEKKVKFKRYVLRNTVGQVSKSWGAYMSCMTQGGARSACKQLRKSNPTSADPDLKDLKLVDGDLKVGDDIVDALDGKVGAEVDSLVSRELTETLTKTTTKKLLTSAVAVIGVADMAAKIVKTADEGALSKIVYVKNATQYAGFAAGFLSCADQIRSGIDIDSDSARICTEVFKDYEKSMVNQGRTATQRIKYDCNNDGDTADPEDFIDAGQSVCTNKKVMQDMESFTNNDTWNNFIAPTARKWDDTAGWAIEKVNEGVGAITDAIGVTDGIAKLMEISGLETTFSEGFAWLIERVAAPVITGGEVGSAAYDAMFAGIAVSKSNLGGGVGEAREDTIGGAYLSDQQVAQIKAEQYDTRQQELKREDTFARYFSPEIPESLTSQAIMATPSSVSSAATMFGNLFKPSAFIGNTVSNFTTNAEAQATSVENPFGVISYGFPANDPIFTANDGEGMDPDVLWEKYQCDKPPADRPQNADSTFKKNIDGIPFEVPTKTDPCLLEQIVEDAGSRYFTKTYDEGIDDGAGGTTAGGGGQTGLLNPGGLAWPTQAEGSFISSCFNEPRERGPHKGMDIAIAADTPAFAVADGEVILAGDKADGYGSNYVAIKHTKDDGTTFVSGYGHMNSMTVKKGDQVTQAQQVGTIGSQGNSTGPHMHIIINVGGKDNFNGDVDPLSNGMEVPPGALNPQGCPKY